MWKRWAIRAAVLLPFVVTAVLAIVFWQEILRALMAFAQLVIELGPGGVLLLAGILFAGSFPLPGYGFGLLLCGFIYGWMGFLLCYTVTLAGGLACFAATRALLRERLAAWLGEHFPRVAHLDRAISLGGLKVLILIRIAPFPYPAANMVLGSSRVSYRDFAVATAVGNVKQLLHVAIGRSAKSLADLLGGRARSPLEIALLVLGLVGGIAAILVVSIRARRALKEYEASTEGKCEGGGDGSATPLSASLPGGPGVLRSGSGSGFGSVGPRRTPTHAQNPGGGLSIV